MSIAASPPIPRTLARLARRLDRSATGAPWSPPPLAELIARIDQALAERQAG